MRKEVWWNNGLKCEVYNWGTIHAAVWPEDAVGEKGPDNVIEIRKLIISRKYRDAEIAISVHRDLTN